MLAVPLAVPLPETETDVVTLAVEVLAVLDALAEPAIAWLVLNIKDNNRPGNTNCFETFIDRPLSNQDGVVPLPRSRALAAACVRIIHTILRKHRQVGTRLSRTFLLRPEPNIRRNTPQLFSCLKTYPGTEKF